MNYNNEESRDVFAYKLRANASQANLGRIAPIFQMGSDNAFESISEENFCPSKAVFITSGYEDGIDKKFQEGEIFRIKVNVDLNPKAEVNNPCKFVASGTWAERLKPKELIEVIEGDLPDRNSRELFLNKIPGTIYVFINPKASESFFGPFQWELISSENDEYKIKLKIIATPLYGKAPLNGQIYQIPSKRLMEDKESVAQAITNNKNSFYIHNLSILNNA